MTLSQVWSSACFGYSCHCPVLFVDREGEGVRPVWRKLVLVWGRPRHTDENKAKEMKACDKMCEAAVWLPPDCLLIAFLFSNHKKKKKSSSLSSPLWHNRSPLRTRLVKHFRVEINFPPAAKDQKNSGTGGRGPRRRRGRRRGCTGWLIAGDRSGQIKNGGEKGGDGRCRWSPAWHAIHVSRACRVQAPAAGTSSPS